VQFCKPDTEDLMPAEQVVKLTAPPSFVTDSLITINGKETPHLVPFHVRMKLFFFRYERNGSGYLGDEAQNLSSADEQILSEYAQIHQAAIQGGEARYNEAYLLICATGSSLTAMQLATAIEQQTLKSQEEATQRYQSVLRRLTPKGRLAIERVTFERIRPVIVMDNPLAVAAVAPEWYKSTTLTAYEAFLSGDLEKHQRILEEAVRKRTEDFGNHSSPQGGGATSSLDPRVKFHD
jgi:hypothetical protein